MLTFDASLHSTGCLIFLCWSEGVPGVACRSCTEMLLSTRSARSPHAFGSDSVTHLSSRQDSLPFFQLVLKLKPDASTLPYHPSYNILSRSVLDCRSHVAVTGPPAVAIAFKALQKCPDRRSRVYRRPREQQGSTPCGMANGTEGSSVEEAFIELANRLADAAAEITTKYFRCAMLIEDAKWSTILSSSGSTDAQD